MAQPIRGMSPNSYAAQVYGQSLEQRNLTAMNPGNQGLPNAYDTGGGALPSVNAQGSTQFAHAIQNTSNNTDTGRRQANAGTRAQITKEATEMSTKQYFLTSKLANVVHNELEKSGAASSLMALNSVLQGPQGMRLEEDLATTQRMFG